MIPKDFIYFSANLTKESQDKLYKFLEGFEEWRWIQRKEKFTLYLHHCTLLHNKDNELSSKVKDILYNSLKEQLEQDKERVYKLKVIGYGRNNHAFAFKIDTSNFPFPPLLSKHTYHVTICTYNGGFPYESNFIEYWEEISYPIEIECVLKENLYK